MAGYMAEFFRFRSEDNPEAAFQAVKDSFCPIVKRPCVKRFSRDGTLFGVCTIRSKSKSSPNVICCPIRLYGDDYELLDTISMIAFGKGLKLYAGSYAIDKAMNEKGAVAVFGSGWNKELKFSRCVGNT